MRILVVDDDRAIRLLLESKLKAWRHTVGTAGNGRDAWQLLEKEHFDLVISDWSMPEMDGLELCRRIRQNQSEIYQYVILCTGKSERADFLAGMEAGADDFMTKPVDSADLQVRLRAAQRIIDANAELARRNAIMKRDREAGSHIQRQLLPTGGQVHPNVQTAALFVPSLDLAGDMYNCFPVGSRYVVFYQLDVSGHGIPSALMSFYLSRLLVAEPGSPILAANSSPTHPELLAPSEVAASLNRRFQSDNDLYFTLLYGFLDTETLEARMCQAGHPSPLHLAADGTVTSLGSGGFPLGLWPDMDYEETVVQFSPGDRLVLYSDGISECQSPTGEQYSVERLKASLQSQAHAPLRRMADALQADISEWRGGPEFPDDISLLALEFGTRPIPRLLFTRSIASDLDAVAELRGEALELFERVGVPENEGFLMQVVVSEVISNSIEHGYHGETGHAVELRILGLNDLLTIEVLDDAPPLPIDAMNGYVASIEEPVDDPNDEWSERGHGLLIAKRTMDQIWFSRRDGRNVVTMTKRFPTLTLPA